MDERFFTIDHRYVPAPFLVQRTFFRRYVPYLQVPTSFLFRAFVPLVPGWRRKRLCPKIKMYLSRVSFLDGAMNAPTITSSYSISNINSQRPHTGCCLAALAHVKLRSGHAIKRLEIRMFKQDSQTPAPENMHLHFL